MRQNKAKRIEKLTTLPGGTIQFCLYIPEPDSNPAYPIEIE